MRIREILAACALSGALALSAPAKAEPYRWFSAPFGGGGFVSGLIFHPKAKGLLYARTDVGGTYRWDEASRRWIALNDDLGRADGQLMGALSLALDASDPDRVYVAAGEYTGAWARTGAMLISRDRGASWKIVDLPFKLGGNEDGRSTGERLQVDPNQGRILFLGSSRDGLWRSADYGATWRKVAGLPVASPSLVLFDQKSGQPGKATPTLYAGAIAPKGPSLYVSHDGGETWAPEPGAPQNLTAHHAAFDASGALFVTYGDGPGPNGVKTGAVWRRDPAGSWRDITPIRPSAEVPFGYAGLGVDAAQPGVVVVATLDRWRPGDEVFRTMDGGGHWTALGPASRHDAASAPWVIPYSASQAAMGHWIGALTIDPFDPGDAVYGTGYGLWRTGNLTAADGGSEKRIDWRFADEGLEETVPLDLVSPPSGHHLLAAVGDVGGVAYDSFEASPAGGFFLPDTETNRSVAMASLNPLRLARTSDQAPSGGYQSFDGGASWTPFPASPRVDRDKAGRYLTAGTIALSAKGGFMVWAPGRQGAFVSRDGGRSWAKSSGWPEAGHMTLTPVADPLVEVVFYVNDPTRGEISLSVDGGASFQPLAKGLPQRSGELRLAPGHRRDLWLPTPQGLFHSAGASQPLKTLKAVDAAYALGFGKAAPGHDYPALYLAGRVLGVEGLFRSDDVGEHWTRINDARHQFGEVSTLTGDPRVYGRIYLATGGRGVIVGEPESR